MNIKKVTQGRDGQIILWLEDPNATTGRLNLTNWSLLKFGFPLTGGGKLIKQNTLVAGVDEVQTITFSNVPDEGGFKLTINGETTATILFSDNAAAVQVALRALESLSTVTVAGSFAAGFVVTFTVADGLRAQDLMGTADNTLALNPVATVVTVTETTPGISKHGVEVISLEAGTVKIWLSEVDTDLLNMGPNQNISADVRIQDQDVNFDEASFKGILTVQKNPFAA